SAAFLIGVVVAWPVVSLLRPLPSPPLTRLTMSAPGDAALALDRNDRAVAISPNGSVVAYTGGGNNRLYLRALNQLQPTLVSGSGDVREPFFSPDGSWLGFFEPTNRLQKVSTSGGPPVPIATLDSASRGATWAPDGTIIFATSLGTTGLQRISANGGEPTVLTRPNPEKGERDHFW